MAYCSNCGKEITSDAKFCPFCGAAQNVNNTDPEKIIFEGSVEQSASGQLNIGQLVWSILNIFMCCMPLGIAGLILTILAKDEKSAEKEAKNLKAAKICNLIGTLSIGIIAILYVFLIIIGALGLSAA